MEECLNRWYVNNLYHNCRHNCLPEDEPSTSKHVENIVKIKILVEQKLILLVHILLLYEKSFRIAALEYSPYISGAVPTLATSKYQPGLEKL